MIGIDADVLTLVLMDDPAAKARLSLVPEADQFVPIVVAEEIARGRLSPIRMAESGRGRPTLEEAYARFEAFLMDLRRIQFLPYTATADQQFKDWKRQKIRVGTRDVRITAITVSHGATLVTRNVRDFGLVPGLTVEVW